MEQPSFYSITPAYVRYCKELEPNAKLLYGEITALANQSGYCWSTNKYFAELYDVDERTVRRWISSLAKFKFIKITSEKKGIKTERKIWISHEIQKMFTKGQKCPGGEDKNVLHNNTYEYTKKNIIKRKPEDPSPKITFNALTRKFEGITQEDINGWRKTHPSVNVDKVIDECAIWALSNLREHYRISLNTFMKNTEKNHTTPYVAKEENKKEIPEREVEENKAKSQQWEKEFEKKRVPNYGINAKPSSILFIFPSNETIEVSYHHSKEEFEKKCHLPLSKLKLKK